MTIKKNTPTRIIKNFLKRLGPGLITGASDDDPSGIATYSQAGAQFGVSTLWTALITFPLMFAIQEMCARIGLVTSKGLMTNINENYPKSILYLTLLVSAPAIVLNIGADIAGMGAISHLLFPSCPEFVFSVFFMIIITICIIVFPYRKISGILKYLCLSLLLYLIVPFLTKQNWPEIWKNTFIPTVKFNKDFLNILVAILGTTISPYLFFWQTTMEAEERKHKQVDLSKLTFKNMIMDVGTGMFFSNLVMYFIILTTGTVLFKHGITHIDTVEQAARALEPIAGKACYLLFALGVIGTGMLAIPVFAACLSYMLASTFKWQKGLDKKYYQAKLFYAVIVVSLLLGLGIDYIGMSPIKVLVYTAVLYGVSAPPLIIVIMCIANNKKIMGKFTNSKWSNVFGGLTFIFMTIAAVLLLYFQFV